MSHILFMGKDTFTVGIPPSFGDAFPDVTICTPRMEDLPLRQLGGPMLLNIFPSVDTSVCAKSLKAFNEQCASLTGLKVFHISRDLPFALDRFIKEHQLEAAVGSCFRSDFSDKLGLTISSGPLKGLCARCVLLLDGNMNVRYIELVSEISNEPDYNRAIDIAIDIDIS